MAAGDPVISVDTKKKELVGPYENGGRKWELKGARHRSRPMTSWTGRGRARRSLDYANTARTCPDERRRQNRWHSIEFGEPPRVGVRHNLRSPR